MSTPLEAMRKELSYCILDKSDWKLSEAELFKVWKQLVWKPTRSYIRNWRYWALHWKGPDGEHVVGSAQRSDVHIARYEVYDPRYQRIVPMRSGFSNSILVESTLALAKEQAKGYFIRDVAVGHVKLDEIDNPAPAEY